LDSIAGLILLTVLGGAAYPAFYISSLKPANIVKQTGAGSKNVSETAVGSSIFSHIPRHFHHAAFIRENKITEQSHGATIRPIMWW